MLNKLAIGGIKHRIRDYSVLFSGLMIAAAIFYMFMSLAMNKDFLSSNSPAAATVFIFGFGAILLAIITIVYINYANKFLLSMRQKEYGMFMMLGAKSSKISKMIFVETFIIGAIASIIGVLLGIFATGFVGQLLMKNLDMPVKHFSSFYIPALIATLIFFVVIFIFSALRNSISLRMTKVLTLLNKDSQPTRVKRNTVWTIFQAIIGLIFIAIGYAAMIYMGKNAMFIYLGVPIALVTIVLGTYFVMNSLTTTIISALKKNGRFAQKGLNNFTLSQLNFRVKDYTKILSMVSIMFSLALGAITVGLGFYQQIDTVVNGQKYYDSQIININSKEKALVDKMSNASTIRYDYKITDKTAYYRQSDIKSQPYTYNHFDMDTMFSTEKKSSDPNNKEVKYDIQSAMLPKNQVKQMKVVSDQEYNQIKGQQNSITYVKTDSFRKNLTPIKQVSEEQQRRFPILKQALVDKYVVYKNINGFFSGLEFMGFFLGVAFLAMLASCLMFKILSGAAGDVKRYNMLHKIGARQKALKSSINKEIAVLFAVPATLGIVHVLVGLQMFKALLLKPYGNLALPFIIFFVLYGGYYFLTRHLYKKIVLK
ncbi:FtsX-like permease family protein [Companilactobacillus furfuricola]|uniref:FtsX-like permease family protein n=1 Tax=Companilactobacillus furfuricola TaxID=1462575 RepID=UPI000F798F9C|nr:ABC transporter permease [Companilactobacillus furfuricola]